MDQTERQYKMATTREQIRRWLERGKEMGASHMIVMCDTFDFEDYPVYVAKWESARAKAKEKTGNMQKVMECYDLSMDLEKQLNEFRCHNYD